MRVKKDIALDFEQLLISGQIRDAFDRYVHPVFLHHNPYVRGDRESLILAMEDNAAQFAHKEYEVKHVLEDVDVVAIHSRLRLTPDMPDMAVIHIYRFAGEKIVEEWDFAQPLLEDSPNEHGFF